MVDLAVSPSFRTASCCSVDVVKGAAGDRDRGLREILETVNIPFELFLISSITASCSFSVLNENCSTFVSLKLASFASKDCFPLAVLRWIDQYSSLSNCSISCSRSTIRRRAGLCTRPADKFLAIFRHKIGDKLNPTRWSSARRACCALTNGIAISRGLVMASCTADSVIS